MYEDKIENKIFLSKKRQCTIFYWLICGLSALYYSYEYFLRIFPSVMESSLREYFHLSATGFGFLSVFYYCAYVPMQLPVGMLLDYYGPRLSLTVACFFCVIGTFVFSNTNIFWIAAVGRFLVGFGSSFAFVGVLKLATIWLPRDKLALIAGITASLGTIGAMIADNLLGELVIAVGWKRAVNFTALFGFFLAVMLWIGIRDKKQYRVSDNLYLSFRKSFISLCVTICNKQIWVNGFFGCLVYLPTTVFAELWGVPYLVHACNFTQEEANFANSLLFFGFTVGAPLMGYISDRLRCRKIPMLFGASGAAIVMLIILYYPWLNKCSIDFLVFILGILYSVQCIVFVIGREIGSEEYSGTSMAVTNMIVMLGAMFLQPFVGNLLDLSLSLHTNKVFLSKIDNINSVKDLYTRIDYQFALSSIPIGIIIAVILAFFLKETYVNKTK
ncbi:MFS transporter [Candidatus Legionella polyplacis]|uniref:MFS transporter n=1 Tax=Candidatus Legionella polyplacis TaxID=2005262 RepID=UPI000C1EF425|nr:MFS transporter [Candidatus Legionella polyplacis]ATW01968.1 MFS transporter [Candidatus Legionella polyplacis]